MLRMSLHHSLAAFKSKCDDSCMLFACVSSIVSQTRLNHPHTVLMKQISFLSFLTVKLKTIIMLIVAYLVMDIDVDNVI